MKETFDRHEPDLDVGGRVLRGGLAAVLGQGTGLVLQLVSVAILARLLTPQDFGIVGMVLALTGFLAVFRDLGLSAATVQQERLSGDQLTSLFWIHQALGWGLGLLMAAVSPVVAWFYNEPRLLRISMVLALAFPLASLSVLQRGLLQREMRFERLAVLDVASQGVGFLGAVLLAKAGAGYWALVSMPILSAGTQGCLMWFLHSWRPRTPRHKTPLAALLSFGGTYSAYNVVNYLIRNLDDILIGLAWGPASLGFYVQAYKLLMLPLQQVSAPVSRVMFPTLSRLRMEPGGFAASYLLAVKTVAWVTMPGVALMAVCAGDLVLAVLGQQWYPAVRIFRILAIIAFLQPVGNTVGWVFLSLGRTRRMLGWGLVASGVYTLAYTLGLPYGPEGVAWGYAVAGLILLVPSMTFAFRETELNVSRVLSSLAPPLLGAAWVGIVVWIIRRTLLAELPLLNRLTIELLCGLVLAWLALAASGDRWMLKRLFSTLVRRKRW